MKLAAAMVGIGLLACASGAAAADLQSTCTRTVLAYADAWDHHDAAAFSALFTDDAVLDLGTGPARGKAAIAALFARRNPIATTRHLMSNITVTPVSATAAEGRSYLQLFAGLRTATNGVPLEAEGYTLVGEYQDRFSITAQGCRFAERRLVTVFRRPRPANGPAPATAGTPPRP